jgi:hypothetical protein
VKHYQILKDSEWTRYVWQVSVNTVTRFHLSGKEFLEYLSDYQASQEGFCSSELASYSATILAKINEATRF